MASSSQPTSATYTRIGIILAVLTLIEFGILYVPPLKSVAIALLLALSIAKFALVVQHFMHLRYERRILTWLFLTGLLLSLALWYSLWAIMYYRIPSTTP